MLKDRLHRRSACLNGIPEPDIALEYHLTPFRSRILSLEDDSIDNNNEANETVRTNAEGDSKVEILQETLAKSTSQECHHITYRAILLSKHSRASYPTQPAESNQRRRREGSLPLATDVVSLVGHDRGNTAVRSGTDKEDAKVAYARWRGPSQYRKTNETEAGKTEEDRSP